MTGFVSPRSMSSATEMLRAKCAQAGRTGRTTKNFPGSPAGTRGSPHRRFTWSGVKARLSRSSPVSSYRERRRRRSPWGRSGYSSWNTSTQERSSCMHTSDSWLRGGPYWGAGPSSGRGRPSVGSLMIAGTVPANASLNPCVGPNCGTWSPSASGPNAHSARVAPARTDSSPSASSALKASSFPGILVLLLTCASFGSLTDAAARSPNLSHALTQEGPAGNPTDLGRKRWPPRYAARRRAGKAP